MIVSENLSLEQRRSCSACESLYEGRPTEQCSIAKGIQPNQIEKGLRQLRSGEAEM